MTLEQLRIFVAVAEREHLTKAAAVLHLSASAASTAIKGLEDRYRVRLFDRIGRGIALTATGRLFLGEARATLAAAAAAADSLSQTAGLMRGRLSVQASQTVAAYWVPGLLMRFHQTYPGVELDLGIGNSETVARAVADGTADLGFVEGDIAAPEFEAHVVAEDRLSILTAPDHPWARRDGLTPPEIGKGRWILREPGSGTRSAFSASLAADGIDVGALDIALILPSNEAILTALMTGPFAGVTSERVAAMALAAGALARIDYPIRPRAFRMLWHKARHPGAAARALKAMAIG